MIAVAGACNVQSRSVENEATSGSLKDSADKVVFGARFSVTDRGFLRAEVTSDTAFFIQEDTRLDLRNVHAVFVDRMGTKEAVLSSRRGRYDVMQGMMEASGDVIITSVAGRTLTTSNVRFDAKRGQVSSDSAFEVSGPGLNRNGRGFSSDADLQDIRLRDASNQRNGPVTRPR